MALSKLVPLEELHRALVFQRSRPTLERAEVSPLTGFGIPLARVEAIPARRQFSNHRVRVGRWPLAAA